MSARICIDCHDPAAVVPSGQVACKACRDADAAEQDRILAGIDLIDVVTLRIERVA